MFAMGTAHIPDTLRFNLHLQILDGLHQVLHSITFLSRPQHVLDDIAQAEVEIMRLDDLDCLVWVVLASVVVWLYCLFFCCHCM